ncbi:MAG: hypothetical protein JXR96_27425 [Deltaproteobacteria bacterium]|nr:hypothetical protein [Deltaproteobacteria bacterium]
MDRKDAMDDKPKLRCMRCQAPIPFVPGAGSRLCPFCGTINLVREQRIAVPPLELKTDEVFRIFQLGQHAAALEKADRLRTLAAESFRLEFYRAAILLEMGRKEDAIFALIDLSGLDAPAYLRADAQAKLSEALLTVGRIDESVEAAERCLFLVEGHPAGSYHLARAFIRTNRLDEAARIAKETLDALESDWRVTFPPQAAVLRLLQAKICELQKRPSKAAEVLASMLLHDTTASLDAVATAARMLGQAYLDLSGTRRLGLELLRQAALLDPENRRGLLDALGEAARESGGSMDEERQIFKESREQLMREIREALRQDRSEIADPDTLVPETELSMLDRDSDRRCDLLERTAERLQLMRFDRGTLYPLRSMEDFRRWVASWRLRQRVQQLEQDKAEVNRVLGLRSLRDAREKGDARSDLPRDREPGSRRRWTRWLILLLLLLIVGLSGFVAVAGDRWFDEFEGRLYRIECQESGDCTLHIDAGQGGRERYKAAHDAQGIARFTSSWLDGRVQADGTILYPLTFAWGGLDEKRFEPCIGRPIAKMAFTLTPICAPARAHD